MRVSVIICTYNRSGLLRRTLQALTIQTVKPDTFEVIIVDDGSRDDTAQVQSEMKGLLKNLRYIPLQENVGAAAARNRGIEAAAGEYILFTDDDCVPAADWIERMCARLEESEVVAGAISSPHREYLTLSHNISQFHPFMQGRHAGQIQFATTANLGVRRDLLEKVGGFRTELRIAQDTEWSLRLQEEGFSICFAPDTVVSHVPDHIPWRAIFRHSTDHAAVTIHLRNRYRGIIRTPFVLRSPAAILLCAPFIAFKVTAEIYLGNPELLKVFWTAPLVYSLKLAWCWGAARGLRGRPLAVTP